MQSVISPGEEIIDFYASKRKEKDIVKNVECTGVVRCSNKQLNSRCSKFILKMCEKIQRIFINPHPEEWLNGHSVTVSCRCLRLKTYQRDFQVLY